VQASKKKKLTEEQFEKEVAQDIVKYKEELNKLHLPEISFSSVVMADIQENIAPICKKYLRYLKCCVFQLRIGETKSRSKDGNKKAKKRKKLDEKTDDAGEPMETEEKQKEKQAIMETEGTQKQEEEKKRKKETKKKKTRKTIF